MGSSNKPPMMPASTTNLNGRDVSGMDLPAAASNSSANVRGKQFQLQKEAGHGYQPERRSPNAARQISHNSNFGSDGGMLPQSLIANLNAQNYALNGNSSAPK
jgi:hypothetical protein